MRMLHVFITNKILNFLFPVSCITPCQDGKVQDSNARSKPSEENVSGRPQKKGEAASPISGGSKEPAASRMLPVARSSEVAGRNYRNAPEPTGGDFQENSSGSFMSCRGGLGSLPCARDLENGASRESPFKKLYDSMKEELDVKSEKGDVLQSGKKSGSRGHRASEKECSGGLQAGTHVPVSSKSRSRLGRSTHVKADPALEEQGISQTEDRSGGEEAVETPKDTRGPVVPPEETTKPKTPIQRSPQTPSRKRQHQDGGDTSGRASADRGPEEGFGAGSKSLTPRKSLTRNQTPAQVESAADFGDTPEKRFSRKRKSMPTSVDVLTPETEAQNPAILAPLPVQVERKIPNSSVHQPEKGGAAPGRMHSGLPGRSSVDPSNFGESISKFVCLFIFRPQAHASCLDGNRVDVPSPGSEVPVAVSLGHGARCIVSPHGRILKARRIVIRGSGGECRLSGRNTPGDLQAESKPCWILLFHLREDRKENKPNNKHKGFPGKFEF